MTDGRPKATSNRPARPTARRFTLSLDQVKAPLAGLGLLLLACSVGYYLIFAQFDTPMRILLAAGILLVGTAVAIDPEAVWGQMTTRNALYGGNTLAVAAIVLGIIALINVLGARRHERWDLTSNKQFSLSDETVKVLQQVDQPIRVTGFFQFDDQRKGDFGDLLREYQVRSADQITYEFVDPVEQPALAQQYGIREYGTTVLVMGDRKQQITGTRESDMTTAILRLVNPQPKKAYFTTGHNEHRLDGFDNDGLGQIKTSMESSNFVVEPLNLFATEAVPDDASVVIISGPRQPFTDVEAQAVGAYLDRGGKVMIMADPQVDANLSALVARWNIEIGQRFVVETDPAAVGFRSPFNPVVTKFPVHKITEQMPLVLFPSTTYVTAPKETPAGATMTALAQTTDRSWAESDEAALRDPQSIRFDDGVDLKGPLTLALAVEIRPDAAAGPDADSAAPKTRLVIMGTSRFVTNQVMSLPANLGNRDFFLNATNWLAEAEELISIRAKPTDTRTLFLSSAQQNTILFSTVLFLPLLVLAGGVAVWWSRR